MSTWIEWRPEWAQHVVGKYESRTIGRDGMPEAQAIVVTCTECKKACKCPQGAACACGAEWRGSCLSGAVRAHIARYASLHLHRDPFAAIPSLSAKK